MMIFFLQLLLIMSELPHCFALHSVQRVRIDKLKKLLVFETECPNGTVYYFQMTVEQFFSFHDVLTCIDHYDTRTHFPIGKKMWCHYSSQRGMILYYCQKNVPYFKFENFRQYKYFTHHRLLSFLRRDGRRAAVSECSNPNDRQKEGGGGGGEVPTAHCKRPLSVVLQSSDQSTRSATPTKQRGEEGLQASPRSTDDAVVSPDKEESAILPKRHHPNPRRGHDSSAFSPTDYENLSSPEVIKLYHSSDSMDYE